MVKVFWYGKDRPVSAFLPTMLTAFLLSIAMHAQPRKPVEEGPQSVKLDEREYGKPNPNAPPELSRFSFLIGKWRCDAKLKGEDGTWKDLKGAWEGRYILDGYAIEDEFRMTTAAGELL